MRVGCHGLYIRISLGVQYIFDTMSMCLDLIHQTSDADERTVCFALTSTVLSSSDLGYRLSSEIWAVFILMDS